MAAVLSIVMGVQVFMTIGVLVYLPMTQCYHI